MYNHVVIEGSSSTKNYTDESGKFGFAGRIEDHLRQYCQGIKRDNGWRGINTWTYVSNYAMPGRLLPEWAGLTSPHIIENLRRSPIKEQAHRLGIFVLEAHPLALQQRYGQKIYEEWRDSLERVKDTCFDLDTKAFFVQMPPPERNIGKKGHAIHNELARITMRTVDSMDGEATLVSVANMFDGHPLEPFLADDRMHPDARGHEVIFRNLLPMIYKELDLEQREPFPDPAELFGPAYS